MPGSEEAANRSAPQLTCSASLQPGLLHSGFFSSLHSDPYILPLSLFSLPYCYLQRTSPYTGQKDYRKTTHRHIHTCAHADAGAVTCIGRDTESYRSTQDRAMPSAWEERGW